MNRSRRLRKILLWGLGIVLILGIGGVLTLKYYLSSDGTNQRVVSHLQTLLGGRVSIASTSVGLVGGSSLEEVEIYEKDAPPEARPWLKIKEAEADVSALDLLGHKGLPEQIDLDQAELLLRFARNGQLVTRLPRFSSGKTAGPLPRIQLKQSKLILEQQGRAPMVIDGVDATLSDQHNALALQGTLDDPFWGKWTVQGQISLKDGAIALVLATPEVDVTQEKLEALAFVPPSIWENVRAQGTTPVQLRLEFKPAAEGKPAEVSYRVELEPRDTTVTITAIALTAHRARGKVVVADEFVQLREVVGQTADGTIQLPSAALDFRQPPTRLRFTDIRVDRVKLSKLPKTWKLPPQIDGRLKGKANLTVTIPSAGPVSTQGTGEGQIFPASIIKFQPKEPILLRLHAEGQEFRFGTDMKSARALMPALVPALGLLQPPPSVLASEEPARAGRGLAWLSQPLQMASQIPFQAALLTTRGLLTATTGMHHLVGVQQPAANAPPSYLEVNFALEKIDLPEFLRRLEIKPPFPVEGKLTIRVQAAIPLDTPRDLKAYRVRGNAQLHQPKLAGLQFDEIHSKLSYAQGVLELTELSGKLPPKGIPSSAGTFAGSARLEVEPRGELAVDLKLQDLPLQPVLTAFSVDARRLKGNLSGTLKAQAPSQNLSDPGQWQGTASLRSPTFQLYGLTLGNLSGEIQAAKGKAQLRSLQATLEGTRVLGSGEVDLSAPYGFRGQLRAPETDLAALERLAPAYRPGFPVAGRVQLNADLQGTVEPWSLRASGAVLAQRITLNKIPVEDLSFQWSQTEERLLIQNLESKVFRGAVAGSASLPLAAQETGTIRMQARAVELADLVKAFPDLPLELEGQVTGTVQGTVGARGANTPRPVTAQVQASSPRLRVQGIPAERIEGTLEYREGQGSYLIEGQTLGGRFQVEGKFPAEAAKPEADARSLLPVEGRLRVQGVRLRLLWEAFGLDRQLGALSGQVSLDLPFRLADSDSSPSTPGRFEIQDVRWEGRDLARTFSGTLLLSGDILEIRDGTGVIGQGRARFQLAYHLRDPSRSTYLVMLDYVPISRLLLPWPAFSKRIAGLASAHLRGRLGRQWRSEGRVIVHRSELLGIEVHGWQIRFDWTFVPRFRTGELYVRESYAQVGRGRLQGNGLVRWGATVQTEGQIQFLGADVRSFSREVGAYVRGRVTGKLAFRGRNVRSVNDLTALVRANLSQTQPLQAPVLRQIAPLVTQGLSLSTTFRSGQLRARLANGIVRLEELSLSNPTLRMFLEGTVTLQGRLRLEVTARTGSETINPTVLRLLGLTPATIGPIPVGVLLRASEYLANRVVHLRVTGTVTRPVIRIEPVRILTEEAVRFFLIQAG